MTKQEQIEEMGKVMPEKIKDPLDNSRYIIFGKSLRREIARIYYNAGYRKLPEDSVVLSREEYERLKRVENEKDRLYEIKLDLENQLIEKGWTDYEGADEIEKRVSKETAEKLLNDFKLWAREYQYKDTVVDENGERPMTNNEKLNYLYTYLCDKCKVEIKEYDK